MFCVNKLYIYLTDDLSSLLGVYNMPFKQLAYRFGKWYKLSKTITPKSCESSVQECILVCNDI